ncbi:5-amino-6-(5-phospho-D-ribitylamino)uracil phosphatase YigB [Candidatus Providencia siddallii]|uniref:5-amino-6-(5-phospho-D-ribitylamino)uracil phosphatase YigB n=1 Tax=Candidatus Providencia siddallii TaxID=1715285 RepID=A0ABM9NNH2_9GAMM
MYFYRILTPIKAITFDLDDTLYENHSVIYKTEEKLLLFIRKYDTRFNNINNNDLHKFRKIIKKQIPEISHDITELRRLSTEMMFYKYGYNHEKTIKGTNEIMSKFTFWRNQINIPESTYIILEKLVKKFPLVAITNGNADPKIFGLDKYFQFVLKAGINGRLKPSKDMYLLATKQLGIEPKFILHVGDNLITDIKGAINSGMQACWINSNKKKLINTKNICIPHVEIHHLSSLLYIT